MDNAEPNFNSPIPVYGIESKDIKDKDTAVTADEESLNKDLTQQIAVCAYFKSEARGYQPGMELQDWLDAEAEINNR